MRALNAALLAVVPLMPPPHAPVPDALPCAMAIELRVHVPLGRHHVDLSMITHEVDRVWAPYGVTLCWTDGPDGCPGVAIRLRVLVTDALAPPPETRRRGRVLAEIALEGGAPRPLILLSLDAVRRLVEEAVIGGTPLGSRSPAAVDNFVPRVAGRALAHEIGHYLLGSRQHRAAGLMTASFGADDAVLGPAARFRLRDPDGRHVREACGALH